MIERTRKIQEEQHQKEIFLAGGCFWGVEKYFSLMRGIVYTSVGYANGKTDEKPTYQTVCSDTSGFAETVHVVYNSQLIALADILQLFFDIIDPTELNRQGNDVGTQYRTGIYYTSGEDISIIKEMITRLSAKYDKKIQIEVTELNNYYLAEEEHQNYLTKNTGGYCHINGACFTKIAQEKPYRKRDTQELKDTLTPLQFDVTQRDATERPFENEYDNNFQEGIYVDITTGEPLFISADKFDSGCGWPAFSKPMDSSLITEVIDKKHGMVRTEVRSTTGHAHLGHVFEDGPKDLGGLRYCINSASLRFIAKKDMKKSGYGTYLPLL